MTCDEARAAFDAERSSELDAHCAACSACAAERAWHRALVAAFAECTPAGRRVATRVNAQAKSRRWLLPVVAVSAAALGYLIAWLPNRPGAPSGPPTVAGIAHALPSVQVQGSGNEWRAARPGDLLTVGSKLRTPPGGYCEIRLTDGSVVRLSEATELALLGPRRMRLENGRLFAHATFEVAVDTPSGELQAKDAEFDVRHDSEGTRVLLLSGSASLATADGATTVPAAHSLTAANGRLSAPQPVFDPVGATQWIHRLLREQGRDSPELAKRIDAWLAQLGRDKVAFLREAEIRALGDHAALPLTRYLQSERCRQDPESTRATAANVLADVAQPWSLPDLVALLDHSDGAVRERIAVGVVRLTGAPFPAVDWRNDPDERRRQIVAEWRRIRDARRSDRF